MIRPIVLTIVIAAMGCVPSQQVMVSDVTDILSMSNPIAPGESFFVLPVAELGAGTDAMIEDELLEYVADDLARKGFRRVASIDSSSFVVVIVWQTSTEITPGAIVTRYAPVMEVAQSGSSGRVGGTTYSGSSQGTRTTIVPVQDYVPPTAVHPESFVLAMLDSRRLLSGRATERYRAESKFTSTSESALTWAPEHLQNMLEHFRQSDPHSTGYLGLGLRTDVAPPIIYEVDPDGPAASRRLKGNTLASIAGERIVRRTQAQRIIKGLPPGQEVELIVEDAEGRRRAVRLKVARAPSYYQRYRPFF